MTPRLLGLLLFPWTLQLGGGQSVIHTGPPIVVTLANKAVSFNCKITYLYISKYKNFKVNYFYVNRQSQSSTEEHTDCTPSQGTENQTHTVECQVTPRLQDASATGTYYCCVHWQEDTKVGNGTFILVRDSGYRKPAQPYLKSLLLGLTGFLIVLSVLGTALLLWKKKRTLVPGKMLASSSKQPPSEPIYTALQRRETEVYTVMESQFNNDLFSRSPLSQEGKHRAEDEGDFAMVYENL